jgi:hypothetical protein
VTWKLSPDCRRCTDHPPLHTQIPRVRAAREDGRGRGWARRGRAVGWHLAETREEGGEGGLTCPVCRRGALARDGEDEMVRRGFQANSDPMGSETRHT